MAELSREEHRTAAEKWLTVAEALDAENEGNLTVLRAAHLAQAHATLALYEPPVERVQPLAAGRFNPLGFYAKLDEQRAAGEITWRTLADQAGVSPSTLTRIGQGHRPDADSLARLLAWLGTTDLAPFLSGGDS